MHTSRQQQHSVRAYDRTTSRPTEWSPTNLGRSTFNSMEYRARVSVRSRRNMRLLASTRNEAKPCTDVEGVSDQRKDVADSPQSEAVEPKARRTKNNCQRTFKVEKDREREKPLQSISTVPWSSHPWF